MPGRRFDAVPPGLFRVENYFLGAARVNELEEVDGSEENPGERDNGRG